MLFYFNIHRLQLDVQRYGMSIYSQLHILFFLFKTDSHYTEWKRDFMTLRKFLSWKMEILLVFTLHRSEKSTQTASLYPFLLFFFLFFSLSLFYILGITSSWMTVMPSFPRKLSLIITCSFLICLWTFYITFSILQDYNISSLPSFLIESVSTNIKRYVEYQNIDL